MFADFSWKKVAVMCIAIVVLVSATAYTYRSNQEYLEGFSIINYIRMAQRAFNAKAYEGELARGGEVSGIAAVLAALTGATPAAGDLPRGIARSIPVLVYHGVVPKDTGEQAEVSLARFKDQMFALKEHGWRTIGIIDFLRAMRGEAMLPEKSFMLTFDDGRKDSYYPVDPILEALDYRAVMYVITQHSLGPGNEKEIYYLSANELEAMAESGRWDLQSHSRTGHDLFTIDSSGTRGHFFGNKLWLPLYGRPETDEEFRARVYRDLNDSKTELEGRFGAPVVSFAFPFNDFAQNVRSNFPEGKAILLDLVRQAYPIAFWQWSEVDGFSQAYPGKDEWLLKRIEPGPFWDADDLLAFLARGNQKPIPYEDAAFKNSGWNSTWGGLDPEPGALHVFAEPETTGGFAMLDGTYGWEDYTFTAEIARTKGAAFVLAARYRDAENYVACKFQDDAVVLDELADGVQATLAAWRPGAISWRNTRTVGISVRGTSVMCLRDGQPIVKSAALSPSLSRGGIGVMTWDPELNVANLALARITVSEPNELRR